MDQEDRRDGRRFGEVQQSRRLPNLITTTAEHKTQGYERFGFNVLPNNDIVYREWAPNALRAYLVGDFSMMMYPSTEISMF